MANISTQPLCNPRRVKTIEEIRLANFWRLVAELEEDQRRKLNDPAIAAATGLSKVYVWQLRNKKRDSIDSRAARKIEENVGLEIGWLDANPEAWPFPEIDKALFDGLKPNQKKEIQGLVRRAILDFRLGESSPPAITAATKKYAT
jgi:hypothetical protein